MDDGGRRTLTPGSWLVSLWTARPLPPEASLVAALYAAGFDDAIFDQRPEGPTEVRAPEDFSSSVQFVATLHRTIVLTDTELARWDATPIGIDVRAPLRQHIEPFVLESGQTYELRWSSRLRQASRLASMGALETVGFQPLKLHALKKNIRLAGMPSASITLWYGIATWTGSKGFIISSDPLFFEDVLLRSDLSPPKG